jgi:propionate CoA-transferase
MYDHKFEKHVTGNMGHYVYKEGERFMGKVVSFEEAVSHVKSESVISSNGFMGMTPDEILAALEKRFLETGEPKNMTFWSVSGQGSRGKGIFGDRLTHPGMVKKVVMGHWEAAIEFTKRTLNEEIEAYNLPQGIMSHLIRAAASGKPGIISDIGLKTCIDPRFDGGRLNAISKDQLMELIQIDGKEYILYKTPKIDACFIRATTADPRGNITMEKEACYLDALTLAQATKANGGVVIVQVERLSDYRAHPKEVVIPFFAVDYIVVAPNQKQTWIETYNPSYTGEIIMPKNEVKEHNDKLANLSASVTFVRNLEDYIIARRAAMELEPNSVINLGMGIASLVSGVCEDEGVLDQITMTVESGPIGGMPTKGGSFGCAINPVMIVPAPAQFDFYDGGFLDATFVGGAEVDSVGNVNVSKVSNRIFGVGGFINITQKAKKVVFALNFTGGKGLEVKYEGGRLKILSEGKIRKFTNKIMQISFSGEVAVEHNQPVLYITERCVFELSKEGLVLIEIAPGIDLEKDILGQMDFKPIISRDLKIMDSKFFSGDSLGLKALWENRSDALLLG